MKLDKIISNFVSSQQYKFFIFGDDYYNGDNTLITQRQKQYFDSNYGRLMCDPYKANHKLASGFYKKIIEQKVQYLLGNGLFSKHKDALDKLTGGIDKYLINIGTLTSKKALSWAFLFKDNGTDKVVKIPVEQIIPFYDDKNTLKMLIRFYITNEVIDNEFIENHKAEIWDAKKVQIFTKKDNEFQFEKELPHFTTTVNFNNAIVEEESNSFGFVPFIPLFNNSEEFSDLKNIKDFIDIYDIVNSDFANNIDDMQDAYYILKNFQGQDLPEFLSQLKKDKVVQVGEDGDVESRQLEIPTEARTKFLDLTHKNIYDFSMSVDIKSLTGGSITNVMIKAMYSDLDLKTDQFEMQIVDHLTQLLFIINPALEPDFVFERSMIINEMEKLNALKDQKGIISDETLFDNHPLVEETEEEIKRKDAEEEKQINNLGGGLGFGDE